MLISRLFVFFSIVEYAAANFLMRMEKRVEAAQAKAAQEEKDLDLELSSIPVDMEQEHKKSTLIKDAEDKLARPTTKKRALANKATRKHLKKYSVDHILVNRHGRPRLRDQHLDVACRWTYPVAYAIVCLIFFVADDWKAGID